MKKMNLSTTWNRLSRYPLGKTLFSKMIGHYAPYSGSINAQVEILNQEECQVTLQDKHKVRNHLNCIHAIALMNLGEIVTGLKVMYAIDGVGRGIVTSLQMHYHKKSRGQITAICDAHIPMTNGKHQLSIIGKLYDSKKDLVAEIEAHWQIEIKDSSAK